MIDRIDWQKVCLNIRKHYAPLAQVAVEVKSGERHLNRLARGEVQQPKFKVAVRLLDIHFDACPDRHNMKELAR